jgi:hypothetical protein
MLLPYPRNILYYAKRNRGYYEPEMRLYILHLPAIFMAGGLIMCIPYKPRNNMLALTHQQTLRPNRNFDYECCCLTLGSISDATLVLVMDSYREV